MDNCISMFHNQVTIYMTELNYTSELKAIDNLVTELENSTDIVTSVDSWLPDMKTYFNEHIGLTDDGSTKLSPTKLAQGA